MNIFVSVIPKEREAIETYKQFLYKAIPHTIPFSQLEYDQAIWNNHSVLSASFSTHASHVAIKNYAASTDNQFCTFNGIPLLDDFYTTEQSWSSVFLQKHQEEKLDYQSIGGYYNLMIVDEDKVKVCNSMIHTEPIYWTENQNCIVIGNRASLVHALANKTLDFEYNLQALISMCTIGWQAHDLVSFKDVNLLPGGHMMDIRPGELKLSPYKPFVFNEVPLLEQPESEEMYSQIYDDLCHEFVKGAQIFKRFSDKLTINLTGGKDSRLAAAMCKEAGVEFSCVTSGGPEDRDVIVAKEIAEILGVEHKSSDPKISTSIPEVDIFEMIHKQVIQGEGSANVYDPCYPIRLKPNVQFAGHGGASYKGGYDNLKGKSRPVIENREMARRFVDNINLHNQGILLLEEAKQQQEEIDDQVVDHFFDSSFPKENFYDYMYTVYREARGTGSNRQASAYGAFQNSPFLNDNALKKGLKIPLELRTNTKLYYNVLYRLNPQLAKHRFADSRWKFEENGPEPDTSLEEWKKRAPLPPSPKKHQAKNWRSGYDTYMRKTIKDYLLSNPKSKIFDIVDYAKLEHLLDQPGPTSLSVVRSVYGIMGTAYLVNNEWIDKPKETKRGFLRRLFRL